jgi:zinc transporter ZupT
MASVCNTLTGVMVTVSVLDLWLPLAMLGWRECAWATFFTAVGWWGTSAISLLKLPDPERVTAMLFTRPTPLASSDLAAAAVDEEASAALIQDNAAGSGIIGGAASAGSERVHRERSWRLGMVLALVLTLHNLPEGLAVALSNVKSDDLGIMLTLAIFVHNIAEGICIAIPILASTQNRILALVITAASGLSEPLGALIGMVVLREIVTVDVLAFVLNAMLCAVGGIMLSISRNELLAEAMHHTSLETVIPSFGAGFLLITLTLAVIP